MVMECNDVVLVTGGSGFIGQHIIRLLFQEQRSLGIKEVRCVDILPYRNTIDDAQYDVRSFVGDLCQPETVADAFNEVNTVFHCAGLISLSYPVNYKELYKLNIDATRVVVDLCTQKNIKHLIYTSCASVCMVPFKGHSTFMLVINQTESKAITPTFDTQNPGSFEKQFLIRGYSASKLRAETIVLNSNGAELYNRKGYLTTTAIRPPLVYGEGDNHFLPNVLSYLEKRRYIYPRISGTGGKQQVAYAGNVAWGHICAYKTLKSSPKAIAGLPVFITDDTPINDISRFLQKIGTASKQFTIRQSAWYLPHFIFFFLAVLYEMFVSLLRPIKQIQIAFSPRVLSSYTASVMMFNRLRAEIHMDYVPLFDVDYALDKTANWYIKSIYQKPKKEAND